MILIITTILAIASLFYSYYTAEEDPCEGEETKINQDENRAKV